MRDIEPEHPHEAGIEERIPDKLQVEGAELLANESRPLLREQGFSDREIDEWALTYIAREHSGDVDSFVAWIGRQEARSAG
jgi:hypothetical protein